MAHKNKLTFFSVCFILFAITCCAVWYYRETHILTFVCSSDNDLYQITRNTKRRFDSSSSALSHLHKSQTLLILADKSSLTRTELSPEQYQELNDKKIRVYIEYPSYIQGFNTDVTAKIAQKRAIVMPNSDLSHVDSTTLFYVDNSDYIVFHDVKNPILAVANVAGYDKATLGIPSTADPLLFENKNFLVAAKPLSNFVTARFSSEKTVVGVWEGIINKLNPNINLVVSAKRISQIKKVAPTFGMDYTITDQDINEAISNGINWLKVSGMLVSPLAEDEYKINLSEGKYVGYSKTDLTGKNADGSLGVLGGFSSEINFDGSQPYYWPKRSDDTAGASLIFDLDALRSQEQSSDYSKNLMNFLFNTSGMFSKSSNDSMGLLDWGVRKDSQEMKSYYGDDNARTVLAALFYPATTKDDTYNEYIMKNVLANFRTTSKTGFRGNSITSSDLSSKSLQSIQADEVYNLTPHFEAWLWAVELLMYHQLGYEPFLTNAKLGIQTMMSEYPDNWRWTESMQEERARMILPLAWLYRVEPTQEHKEWLTRVTNDLVRSMDESGAIPEDFGDNLKNGIFTPLQNNEEYGTREAPLIQENGNPCADLLYTNNFAIFTLQEANSALGGQVYDKQIKSLVSFLVKVQIKSQDQHFNGAWFRGFDFNKWEYYASNSDAGWGAWSIEPGWTQSWVLWGLESYQEKINYWDFVNSNVQLDDNSFAKALKEMGMK